MRTVSATPGVSQPVNIVREAAAAEPDALPAVFWDASRYTESDRACAATDLVRAILGGAYMLTHDERMTLADMLLPFGTTEDATR